MKYLIFAFMLLVTLSAISANGPGRNLINQQQQEKTPTPKPKNDQVTQLDDLMRGEMAALKAYDQALSEIKDKKQRERLEAIRNDHEKAISKLSHYVAGKPDLLKETEDAGPWGTFSKTWVKGRGLTGNEGALKALRQGEEHGVNEYEEALKDESLSNDLKQTIRTELLPKQREHIKQIKSLI